MNKLIFTLTLVLTFTFTAQAQDFKKIDVSPMDMIEYPMSNRQPNKSLRVLYSRPQLKGRALSQLAPEGKVWRTGANEATEITFYSAMNFGGKTIPAGSYTLFTIPGASEWTVILNKDTHVWGAYSYKEANDIARLNVPVAKGSKSLEALSMIFEDVDNGVHLHIGWDTMRIAVPFSK